MLVGARALVWVLYAYVVVTEVVLTLGFVLLLFGADPDASFVAWAYRSLERAMEPFRGMFTPIELGLSGSTDVGAVLDTSVLFAMLVYAFAAWAVHSLLEWLSGSIRKMDEADRRPAIPQGLEPVDGGDARPGSDPGDDPGGRTRADRPAADRAAARRTGVTVCRYDGLTAQATR